MVPFNGKLIEGGSMSAVTISSKYQVVIPEEIRKSMRIKPGQKVEILEYNGRIELIPVVPMKEMRGSLKGIDTRILREKDRV